MSSNGVAAGSGGGEGERGGEESRGMSKGWGDSGSSGCGGGGGVVEREVRKRSAQVPPEMASKMWASSKESIVGEGNERKKEREEGEGGRGEGKKGRREEGCFVLYAFEVE